MRKAKEILILVMLVGVVLLSIWAIACPLPMSRDRATHALSSAGMTDIKLVGTPFFGCKDEKFRRKFEAMNANHQPVKGVVCGGWLTDDTIRYN